MSCDCFYRIDIDILFHDKVDDLNEEAHDLIKKISANLDFYDYIVAHDITLYFRAYPENGNDLKYGNGMVSVPEEWPWTSEKEAELVSMLAKETAALLEHPYAYVKVSLELVEKKPRCSFKISGTDENNVQ